jgi:hypothetical protein
MEIPKEETHFECVRELFSRVGLPYPNPEFVAQENWYSLKSWSREEEDSFREWMRGLLLRRYTYLSDKQMEMELGFFLLNYGWITKEEED